MLDPVVEQTEAQELKAAKAAFSKVDAAPVEAKVDALIEAPINEEPAKEVPVDPWDGVPVVVRQSHEDIARKFGEFSKTFNEHKSNYGKIAATLRRIEAAKEAVKAVEVAPTQAQINAAAKDPEKWATLKNDFTEWTEATEEYVKQQLAAERAEVLKQVPKLDVDGIRKEVGDTVTTSVTQAAKEVRQLALVDSAYPTWESDIYVDQDAPNKELKPEFAAWMGTQSSEVQALADSNYARDALKMLGMYYDHRKVGVTREKNQTRLEAAIPVKGTPGQRQPTTSERDSAQRAFASA